MQYIVRVVICDEFTDSTDASSSEFYGPYRGRRGAERMASSLEKLWKNEEYALVAVIETVERTGAREIVRRLRAAVESE